ncbi:hypothetical protein BD309DRAFT_362818 [Dichomitus squalens]|nr:hypothetical protein BD309DRAFT_362818 [Dichomitus squalens]
MGAGIVWTLVQVVSQVGMLAQVLGGRRDGWLLVGLIICAATMKDKKFTQMMRRKYAVNNLEYLKEFVASNFAEFMMTAPTPRKSLNESALTMRSTITSESAVNKGANSGIGFLSFLQDPLRALTQVIFTLSDYMKFSFTTWRILIRRAQSPSNFRHLGGSTKSPIYLTRWKTARLPSPRTPRNRDIVSLEFKSRLLPCEAEPHGRP